MPDVRTMGDVVRNHTREYLVFLAAATFQSLRNIFATLNLVTFSPLLMIRPAFASVESEDRSLARLTLLVLMLTLAITIAFAYIHPRYLTRLLGLLLVAGFLGLREAIGRAVATRWAVIGLTIIIVGGNLLHFDEYLAAPHSH